MPVFSFCLFFFFHVWDLNHGMVLTTFRVHICQLNVKTNIFAHKPLIPEVIINPIHMKVKITHHNSYLGKLVK